MSSMPSPKRRPLKVGLGLPLWNTDRDGKTPTWQGLLALARYAEDIGFDSLWVPDGFSYRTPTGELHDFWECWSVLSALAAATSRITLGSFVSYIGYRNPVLLAKMACTIDEVSGGRLVLGVGAGYTSASTEAAGFPTEARYTRLEEALIILQQLFRYGSVHFEGQCYQVRDYELLLRGPRPTGPPLLLGSFPHPGPRLLHLAVKYAQQWNGWLGHEPCGLDLLPSLKKTVDEACQRQNHPPEALERSLGIGVALEGIGPEDPGFTHVVPVALRGTPEVIAQSLLRIAHLGFSEVQICLHTTTLTGLKAFVPVLDALEQDHL